MATHRPSYPSLADAPGYWMYETSGVLAPVVTAFICGEPLDLSQIATMRAYLRQWIMAPAWSGNDLDGELDALRLTVHTIKTRRDIEEWLHRALDLGIDPL